MQRKMLPVSIHPPVTRRIHRALHGVVLCAIVALTASASAQTVVLEPEVLRRIPTADIGQGRYWQQLRITLAHDDAASPEAISVDLPEGVIVADLDGDGALFDEVRVVYAAAGSELPRFKAATVTSDSRIVIESQERAGAAGVLYVQFPIFSNPSPSPSNRAYRGVQFADGRETDLLPEALPELDFVDGQSFASVGSMGLVDLGAPLASGVDTTTTARGTWFPTEAAVLVLALPDLVFDAGLGSPNRRPGYGDADDANDTVYRFFFSVDALVAVNTDNAIEARRLDGGTDTLYVEHEGAGRDVQLVTRDLPAGSYWLYVTSDVTGDIPLARSRVLVVRHEPVIERLGPEGTAPITFDSGGLLDASGTQTGQGLRRLQLDMTVVDHDDSAVVHLFYSGNPNLGPGEVVVQGQTATLTGATPITTEGLPESTQRFDWDTSSSPHVAAGDYYLYAIVVGGDQSTVDRTSQQILVRHAPYLALDATLDGGQIDTVRSGGTRAQRYLTLTWGRRGAGGDADVDDDARIDLYYSARDDFAVPTDAAALVAAATAPTQDTHLITSGLTEDADGRSDNQYVWDLWSLAGSAAVPEQGQAYSLYGVISDGSYQRLVRMSGGAPGDAGSLLRFEHEPTIRPLQPVADVTIEGSRTARVSWQDMDLDDNARMRIVLSAEDHGSLTDYDAVTAGLAFVVNSSDGRALTEVDTVFDLSEDSDIDYFDVGISHLSRSLNADGAPQPGTYTLYLALSENSSFDSDTRAWRVPGRINVANAGAPATPQAFRLLPEAFTIGNGGGSQRTEVVVDAQGEVVDLVVLTLRVDGNLFTARDMNLAVPGIQPFAVSDGFGSSKLVANTATQDESGGLFLSFEYFDPVPSGVPGLDGSRALVYLDLIANSGSGAEPVQLVADVDNDRLSQLERGGSVILVPAAAELATAIVVEGRATIGGRVVLEGRADRTAIVDVALRSLGQYVDLVDSLFLASNDEDEGRPGLQVSLDAEGDFALLNVPSGRLDLHLRRAGYLDGVATGLELFAGAIVGDVRPSSTATPGDSLLLGGDVAGYVDSMGVSVPDNEVTLADWDFVASLFGREVTAEDDSARADISGDGVVNIRDLSLVGANFRRHGPRPVYRRVVDASQPTARLHVPTDVAAGDTVAIYLSASPSAAHAAQIDLLFDATQWLLLDVRGSAGTLTAATASLVRSRVALASIGGVGLPVGQLARWRFVARTSDPAQPVLADLLLLDASHRDLPVYLPMATDVEADLALPVSFDLRPNYPNPFNPETIIEFAVPHGHAIVQLAVFDILGQRVAVLADGVMAAGVHRVAWDGRDLRGHAVASGVYFARLFSAEAVRVHPMLLLR